MKVIGFPIDGLLVPLGLLANVGMILYIYDYLCNWARLEALIDRPSTLFTSCFFQSIFIGICVMAVTALMQCLCSPIAFLWAGYALFVSYDYLKVAKRERAEYRSVLADNPVPKFQFTTQDLLSGMFVFGMMMLVYSFLFLQIPNPGARAVMAFLIASMEVVAFLIAMDICRFGHASQEPISRFGLTTKVMIVAAIPCMFGFVLITWKAWRYALWKSRVPRDSRR